MKRSYVAFILAAGLLASCASVPTELYDAVTALRLRASRFPQVQTYAPQDFSQGEVNYNEASQLISTKKDLKRTPELLTAAQAAYLKVIEIGMPAYAADLRTETDVLLEEALAVKANAGLKTQYDTVVADYEAAKTLEDAKDYDNAIEKFEKVKAAAQSLLETVKKQYDSSLAEVAVVKQKQAQLETLVQNIEQLTQAGGE